MGLSDQERIDGIYHSIHRLSGLRHQLIAANRDQYYMTGLETLAGLETELAGLWHCLLAEQTNGMHWIFGSDSDGLIRQENQSPWAVAIQGQMPLVDYDWEMGNPIEWQDNSLSTMSKEKVFFDPFDNGFLMIPALLRAVQYNGQSCEIIFLIYRELETLIYYLRRYKDELLLKFADLNTSISTMQGGCFSIFCMSDDYSKAYALHSACKLLYGTINSFDKEANDAVTQWAVNQCLHHSIPSVMNEWSLKDVAALHLEAVYHKDDLLERLLSIMRLAGKRYHHKHEYDELCKSIKDHPVLSKPEAKSRIETQFKVCSEAYKQEHKDTSPEEFQEMHTDIYRGC